MELIHAQHMLDRLSELRDDMTKLTLGDIEDFDVLVNLVYDLLEDESDSIELQNRLYEFLS